MKLPRYSWKYEDRPLIGHKGRLVAKIRREHDVDVHVFGPMHWRLTKRALKELLNAEQEASNRRLSELERYMLPGTRPSGTLVERFLGSALRARR